MAFWRIGNGFSSISAIDKILDKPYHTLVEILEEPDLLTELLAPNTKLIEYLRSPEVMAEMIRLVIDLNIHSDEEQQNENKEVHDEEIHDVSEVGHNNIQEAKDSEHVATPEKEGSEEESIDNNNEMETDTDSEEEEDDEEEHQRRLDSHPLEENTQIFSDDEDQTSHQRHAQICGEVLSAAVWSLTEALMESTDLLDELWQVLDDPELEIPFASYFTKINEHLLSKKTDEMLEFIRSQKFLVSRLMKHIDNPGLMDFLIKVICTDKPENTTGIIELLQGQRLIPTLISFLGPDVPTSVQSAAGEFLKAFVAISANSNADNNTIGPNELTRELVSEPCVSELVRLMLFGGGGLVTGVGVVIEIIRKNNSDYDYVPVLYITVDTHPPGPRDPIYLGTLVKIFSESIPKFQAMLIKKYYNMLETPFGEIQPLGFERFKVCELVAELLHCSNMTLLNDAKGEGIVKERDEERERLKRMIARARGEIDETFEEHESLSSRTSESLHDHNENTRSSSDEEMINAVEPEPLVESPGSGILETGIEKLDIKNEQAQQSSENAPTSENVVQPSEVRSDDDDEKSAMEASQNDRMSNDDDEHQKGVSMPSLASLEEAERSIRADPVVGDQLKIALADNECITTILNMFFQFPWNNFLHNVVFDIVQQILNGPMQDGYNKFLAIELFGKGRLTNAICQGHADCEEYEVQHKTRLGYMGHLTLISEEVVKFTALYTPESISPIVVDAVAKDDWINYVTHTLVRTREQYNAILGGQRPEEAAELHNPNTIILGTGDESVDHDIGTEFGEDLDHAGQIRVTDGEGNELAVDDEDHHDRELEASGSGQFARYMTQEMTNSSHFGSSDEEEDDDEWETDRMRPPPNITDNRTASEEDDEDDDEDEDDLNLVRSRSYNEMNWDDGFDDDGPDRRRL